MNKFSRENYPTLEPSEMRPDVTWTWQRPDLAGTYEVATHSLQYKFYSLEGKGDFTQDAIEFGDSYIVEFTPADIRAGHYKWVALITETSTGRVAEVADGFIRVLPGEGEEQRSHTLIVLQAIRATIEKTATKEQASYSIAGRSLARRSVEELTTLERQYMRRWENEKARINRKNGRKPKSKIIKACF